MQTDAELIAQARNDPDAFGELYSRHARAVFLWFRARTNESIASELTAETFAQAALSLKRFRDQAQGSARPWLVGIARNLLRRSYERERIERNARRRLGMPIRSYELDLNELADRVDAGRALRRSRRRLTSSRRRSARRSSSASSTSSPTRRWRARSARPRSRRAYASCARSARSHVC